MINVTIASTSGNFAFAGALLTVQVTQGGVFVIDAVNPTDTLITSGSIPSLCPAGFTCTTSALSFIQDISNDGYRPGVDTLLSATVTIHLTDSSGNENYTFTLDGSQQFISISNVPGGSGSTLPVILTLPSLADLAADGTINVKVESTSGDFFFADSTLTARILRPVPGPPSIVLSVARPQLLSG